MACLFTTGWSLGCRDSIAGISTVYLGNFNVNQLYTLDANNEIISCTASTGTASYYKIEQERQTSQLVQEASISEENGSVFYTQTLSLTFQKNDTTLRNLLLILSQALITAIVKDQKDNYWLLGYKGGLRSSAISVNSGKAYGDLNGATVTLTGFEANPAYLINDITKFYIEG
jgi:hypothetical protein